MTVYLAQFHDYDGTCTVGVFSSEEKAKSALHEASTQNPGLFAHDTPCVVKYTLDELYGEIV
jgi:hypothetical protein